MAFPLTAIATVGSSLLGGLFGKKGVDKQNAANIASAREQMDFQERMSNTAHQREIKDLRAAGLNPILSAKLGGASSPGGAAPNIQDAMAPIENSARSLSDKVYNSKMQTASVNNMQLQNDLLKEQVKAASINNARSGVFTPVYNKAGELINNISDFLDKNDIVGDVMNAGPSGSSNAKSQYENVASRFLDKHIGNSGIRKFANGEEGLFQSIKAAQLAAAGYTKAKTMTAEDVRRYAKRHSKQR